MLDFTSALYLGLRHPSASLPPWDALTIGRPAALAEPPDAEAVAAEIASLQGCEAATLLPSTLHLFWDLFRVLDDGQVRRPVRRRTVPDRALGGGTGLEPRHAGRHFRAP